MRQRGLTTMPALQATPIPPRGVQVWNIFMDLINSRPKDHAPISWTELQAYLQVRDLTLDDWDVNTFIAMDRTYRSSIPTK